MAVFTPMPMPIENTTTADRPGIRRIGRQASRIALLRDSLSTHKITLEPSLVQFADLVAASAAVASVSSRLEKIGRLKELLVRLAPDEIETAVAFLSGSTRQGRIGVGYRAIARGTDVPPATEPAL